MNDDTLTLVGSAPDQGRTASVDAVAGGWGWLAVAYGGGTNSTALLCGLLERGIRPDLITFADTGAEMPHTYRFVEIMAEKVRQWWGLEIQICRKLYAGRFEGLERNLQRLKQLPALAYGRRSCSMKYKHGPQERVLKAAMRAAKVRTATRCIGYDIEEGYRIKPQHKQQWLTKRLLVENAYPLVEWGWGRAECVGIIMRHGLPAPGKSACYFCPSMRPSEVVRLRDQYPQLLASALQIEHQAQATIRTPRGLGGKGQLWANWLANDAAQAKLMLDIEPVHLPCGCMDGGGGRPATPNMKSSQPGI